MAVRGLVTMSEAAKICGMTKQALHKDYISRELFLTPIKIGQMNVWDEAEVRKWNANRPKMRLGQKKPTLPSERQVKVIELLAQGLNGVEIAKKLKVHPATVSYLRKAVFRRLNASTLQEAVTKARNLGLL